MALKDCAIAYTQYKDLKQKAAVDRAREVEREKERKDRKTRSTVHGDGFTMEDPGTVKIRRAPHPQETPGLFERFCAAIKNTVLRQPATEPSGGRPRDLPEKILSVPESAYDLAMRIRAADFDKAVACLAAHRKDGWYDVIGKNVVNAINRSYIAHGNSPLKALDDLAPMLAKLEPSSLPPPPPLKGPLL
ncbi:MAG: hypothetical protein HY370_05100 [Proteobacteria bacterium]|nr:hypothetical protein [Pseudomonadota bacterium]